ncbi:MAG: hypothetical protein JWO06_1662 [Bacteroidota bacterium]|nr:hypothetical protein [Bacteroidota bacterium]
MGGFCSITAKSRFDKVVKARMGIIFASKSVTPVCPNEAIQLARFKT